METFLIVFVLMSCVAGTGIWYLLWHSLLAPFDYAIIDNRTGEQLSRAISLLWLLYHAIQKPMYGGYGYTNIREWLSAYPPAWSHFQIIMYASIGSGVLAGFVVAMNASRGALKTVHVEGKRLYNRAIDAVLWLKREIRASGEGIEIHPDVRISRDRETRHFFIMGAIGSGKTQVLLNIIRSIVARMYKNTADRIILYDNKSDFTKGFPVHDDSIALFAPWDARTWAWDVGKDILNSSDADTIAERLIPPSSDAFWSSAGRQITSACIQYLQSNYGNNWGWKELSKALRSLENIGTAVSLYAPTLMPALGIAQDGTMGKTGQSLLATLGSFTGPIDALSRAWDNTDPNTGAEIEPGRVIPRLSLREWALTPVVQRRVLIFQGNKRYLALERAYVQAIISAFGAIMNSPEMTDSKTRRIWLILDEFPQLGKLENFAQYLEVGRSKGMCVVQGLQDLAQLEEIYGRATANVWKSISGTYIVCRSQGVETVRWLTEFFGEKIIRQFKKTRADDGKTSKTDTEKTVPVVSGDDIAGLGPDRGMKKGILALLGLNNDHGVYRLVWPYVTLPDMRPAQMPALWTSVIQHMTDEDIAAAQGRVFEEAELEYTDEQGDEEVPENNLLTLADLSESEDSVERP